MKFNYKIASIAVIFFLLPITLRLGLSQKNISIIPQPQKMEFKNFKVKIDKDWVIAVNTSNKESVFAVEFLNEELNDKLMIKDINSQSKTKRIILATSKDDFEEKERMQITDKIGQEGYVLEVFPSSIVIISPTPAGVFYGVQTLLQLISINEDEIFIPGVKIVDYPVMNFRVAHMLDLKGTLDELKGELDFLARLRINAVIFSEQALWKLEEDSLQAGRTNGSILQELFAYARKRHIEPIPELQSFGIALTLLQKDPNVAEGIWVQDEPFKWINNFAVPVRAAKSLLENSGFETDADGDGVPDGWVFGNEYARSDWFLDKTSSCNGSCSVGINVSGPKNVNSNHLESKFIEVDSDTAYNLTFCARKTAGSGLDYNFAMRISQYDKNNNFIVENYWPLQSSDARWEKHKFNFVTYPDTSRIRIWAAIIDGYGTAWFDDLEFKRMNGELVNVIRTKASDIRISNLAKTKTYAEGKDYIIIDGEMEFPYFVNYNNPTRIKRLETGNIKENETVLVTYDFVLRFHPSTWITPYCPSEPKTYEIFFKALDNVIQLLKPKYINIGHDDIYGIGRDSRCRKRNVPIAELIAEDINKLNNYIHTIDPNIQMMIWDDMINPWHTGGTNNFQMHYGGSSGKTSPAMDLISKDIILMSWWFDVNDHQDKMKRSPDFFKDKGFSYLVVGWKSRKNIKHWLELVKDRKECIGMVVTNWDGWDNNREGIKYTANQCWSGQ